MLSIKIKKGYINLTDIKKFIIGNNRQSLREPSMKKLTESIGIENDVIFLLKNFVILS